MAIHDPAPFATLESQTTSVVVIGAGASGLTLATFLQKSGIACVVLEKQNRAHIEVRQRAGVVEARGVGMFQRWGLADKLLGGEVAQTIEYRVNGVGRVFEIASEDGATQGLFCTQQMLVGNLLKLLIDFMNGDVRFEVADVVIHNEEGAPTKVTYSDESGAHQLLCDYIVGCDADRGVSRASIPEGIITTYSHEFGYSWVAVLAESARVGPAVMGVSDRGFVCQVPRGPQRSRFYLQCPPSDGSADWPEDRLWNEIRLRMGDATIANAPVLSMKFVPMRNVVHVPLQYRNLFLAGDAAHLMPPTAGKGMNLALCDVDVLASALIAAVRDHDTTSLENYTATILPHIWNYEEFSSWMTDTMHDAGDPTLRGRFRQMTARARLDELFNSPTAARLHSENNRGINL